MRDFTSRFGLLTIVTLIVLFCNHDLIAQARIVTGSILDSGDGSALPGATVLVQGTSNGTITDIDGRFSIEASPEDILVISFIGYTSTTVAVGNKTDIKVELEISIEALDEIVVVGYGTQQKKVSTGSISKVTAKNLEGYKVTSVQNALDGQVSGILVNQSSGQPGASSTILIRGISTNKDNTPLYVIDGLAISADDGRVGYNGNPLSNINPDDIESIDVLKDAASCAIYGARAANGVIIITTKKGSKGSGSISYDGFMSVSNPWKMPEMLNAEEYVELTREKYANGGQTQGLDDINFPQVGDQTVDTDWMDVILDQASTINHRVTAQFDGSYLSLEYWDQSGIVGGEKSNYKRYAVRFNSSKDINQYVAVSQNLYINRTESQSIGTNNAFGTVIADAFAYDPITPIYNDTAQYGFAQSEWVQKEYINPLSRLFIANNDGHADQIIGNVHLKVSPVKGVSLHSDFGMDYSWSNYRTFTPDYNFTPAYQSADNIITQGYHHSQSIQFENYANYQGQFGKHNLNFILGTTNIRRAYITTGVDGRNIRDEVKFLDEFQYIDAVSDTSLVANGRANVPYILISYYSRLIYDYNGKYLFSATLRRDGSSRFGDNNRFGIFPSFSLGWVISDEGFFSPGVVSFLKLRTSWGVNGSDRIDDLGYASRVGGGYRYPLGIDQAINDGLTFVTPPNPNLKWEESVQFDLGVETKFLDDRLSLEVDYYVKTTADLLGTEKVSGFIGPRQEPVSNLGEFQNKGIEAAVSYRNSFGKVDFTATLNYTHFENKVIDVPGSTEFINGWGWPVRSVNITRMTEGLPVGHFYGLKTLGIFQSEEEVFSHISSEGAVLQPNAEPGDLIFKDVNGDGIINNDDMTNIGSPWPDHIIGLNLSGAYQGFDVSVLISTQLGQEVYRTYERSDVPRSNYQSFWKDRWTETNPSKDMPRLVSNDPNGNQRPSDFYVEDGSFLRIRNLQVGYSLPQSILGKVKLSGFRIYFTANNLMTLTGYRGFDPEIGTNGWILDTGIDKGYYPSNKTFGGGIKITM